MAHPDIIEFGEQQVVTTSVRPTGEVRWVAKAIFGMDLKLQQAWEVTTYRDGAAHSRSVEWRDVPIVNL